MARLLLILSIASLLVGCASKCPEIVRVYRPDFIQNQDGFTGSPAGLVFDPPALAYTSAFGLDQIEGVSLNQRTEPGSTNGVYELGGYSSYQIYGYDYYGYPGYGPGYLYGTLSYYTQGSPDR